MKQMLTPIKAIREKRKDCTGNQLHEIRECSVTTCALWPYRMGKRPKHEGLDLQAGKGIKQDVTAYVG